MCSLSYEQRDVTLNTSKSKSWNFIIFDGWFYSQETRKCKEVKVLKKEDHEEKVIM